MILFPDRPTSLDDLVAAGAERPTAERIFDELDDFGVGGHAMIVVVPDRGRTSFTTPQRASIEALSLSRCPCSLELRSKENRWSVRVVSEGTSDGRHHDSKVGGSG